MSNPELSWKALEQMPAWKQANTAQRLRALTHAGSPASPAKVLAALEQVLRTRPDLADTVRGGTQQMNDPRPSPRRPLRRARLDQHGNAITWTDTGVIINDLEIIHEPSRDEASREIGTRQRAYMLAGVEAHDALARVLAEIHPVYRHPYMR